MSSNHYSGVVTPEIPRLIVDRARRLKVSPDDIEDLQQRIVPLLAKFQFDHARANGASRQTAMTAVVDRQIKMHLRSKRRYRVRIEQLQTQQSETASDEALVTDHTADSANADRRMDVAKAIADLPEFDQRVCLALSKGMSIAAIAREVCRGRDAVNGAIRRTRRTFENMGLRAWVDANAATPAHASTGRAQ